ncbi:MAG: MerR family transcriptional regulator [Paeniclostridium sordellii]|nr:MerR family transcriptional regulator [Paeniclostridium sordellii]
MYSLGQVVKFLGVSRDTLKFYEDKGLAKIYVFYTNYGH